MTDIPKPGPVKPSSPNPPIRVLPRGAGVNHDDIEMRSRLMALLLSFGIKDEGVLLTLMDRMELGPDFDDDEEAT